MLICGLILLRRLCEQTVVKPKESKERIRSEKIDRILTGKYTAIPCFVGIMVLVFYLTFNVIGAGLQTLLEMGIDKLADIVDAAMTATHVNGAMHSLVIDGIFNGVGSVLSFSTDHRDTVFLPVSDGRQWLYCQSGLCHGQIAAKDWTFRPKYCANADRIWLYSSGGYGKHEPCPVSGIGR